MSSLELIYMSKFVAFIIFAFLFAFTCIRNLNLIQMAACTKLDDLNENRIDWKVQVRCCRKWQVPAHGNFSESLELLLVDKFGTRIQASVKGYIIDRFMDLIIEGGLYLIEQFSVVDRPKIFPVAVLPFKISFHKNTYVGPTVSTRFPKMVFSFRSFSDIKSGSSKYEAPLKTKLECVLWDPYCHQVQNLIERLKNRCGGEIGVSNTFYAIKVVVDQQVEEIVEYISKLNGKFYRMAIRPALLYGTECWAAKQCHVQKMNVAEMCMLRWMCGHKKKDRLRNEVIREKVRVALPDNESAKIYSGSQLSNSYVLSVRDELGSASCVFMTLEELKSSDIAVNVWVTCSISDVLFEKDWCYTSCLKCRRKVSEKEGHFLCEKCGNYVVGNARFKIHIKVVDGKSSANFLLWDDIAIILIGTSASNVCERLGNTNLVGSSKDVCWLKQPYEVDNLIGRELLFKVGIDVRHLENRDNVYVVERIYEDAVLIKEHKLTDHKVLDFQSRPYKDIVQDNDWDPEPSDFDHEFKSPEHVLGKRTEVSSGEDILNECEGSSSSKRRVVKEEDNDD
ncbi:hypothetical protein OROMI_019010 [Orobanche minor]